MAYRQVALGNAEETREARFRGEQVVTTRVLHALGDPIADRQQLALRLDQKSEFHLECK